MISPKEQAKLVAVDATTLSIIERITERYPEPRLVYGGHRLKVFYNCALLNMAELARLAAAALGEDAHQHFDMAVGVAYRGVLFAGALAHGREVGVLQLDGEVCGPSLKGRKVLLVDDVIHSGKRLKQAATNISRLGASVVGVACIVDRSNGKATFEAPLYSAFRTDFV